TLMTSFCPLVAERSLGESLEKQMWDNIKAHNWFAVEKNIASNFQSVHEDGSRDRDQEIDLVKKLNLGSYQITNLKATEHAGVIVVTYTIAIGESIDAKRNPLSTPHPRLSVWRNSSGNWQWIAHANLNP
ncbi:MAG TPA: nuclear transport factor 2 family protein, partial [Waddliaceae bacterium]